MNHEFQRVAIITRGEAAMRFIHAVREFNQEHGTSLRTIALFAEPDRHAMFVREADEALPLGAAQFIDLYRHRSEKASVDYELIKRALVMSHADAVWTGWQLAPFGADFVDLCRELGVVFIGPDSEVIRRLEDKIGVKRLAEQAGIPVVPWSGGPVETVAEARRHAGRLGYPLVIKAAAGNGGHGVLRVDSADQLRHAFESARSEWFEVFGNPTVLMEQWIQSARQVEVPIIADHYGTAWTAPVRDCTIQFGHRKIVVESPSPVLSPQLDQSLREMAVRLSQQASYSNAGVVEFLYEPESQRALFLNMKTGLQDEHPVTECITGRDFVKMQIHVARGGHLEGEPLRASGHAIEVQLNAENPKDDSIPPSAIIERLKIPMGAGIRVDTSVAEGDVIPPEFDTAILKLTAHGYSRSEALSRLQRTLRESVVIINGQCTNKELLLDILSRPEVNSGEVDAGWLDLLTSSRDRSTPHHADVALISAAIEGYEAQFAVEQMQFYASAARLRPSVRSEIGRTVELSYRGRPYSLKTYRVGLNHYRVELDGSLVDARVDRVGRFEYWVAVFGRRFHVVAALQGLSYRIEVDGVCHQVDRDDGGVVHAPSPSVVVSVCVKVGDTVEVGDRLAVLEAMKMEMPVVAPFSGKVRQIMTIPNVQVDTGAPLVRIEPNANTDPNVTGGRVALGESIPSDGRMVTVGSRCRQNLEDIRQLMLGFDINPISSSRVFAEWNRDCPAESDEIRREEEEILSIFVDLCALFDHLPSADDPSGAEGPSAEAYLFSYLRSLSSCGEGLPPSFLKCLRRALAHYGVLTLDRTAELEQSLLWIFKSHQRVDQQVATIQVVLESRLRSFETSRGHSENSFRTLLDGLILTTRGLFPVLSDLAREVRYRYFDRPVFEQARRQVYERAEADLAHLAADPEGQDRSQRVRDLVECPQPLVSLFSGYFATAHNPLRQVMLEVLLSRHYRIRSLLDPRALVVDGHCFVTAEYDHEGKRIHVFTTHAEHAELSEALRTMVPMIAQVPVDDDVAIDLYVWQTTPVDDPEAAQQELCRSLNQTGFGRSIRRITAAVAGPSHGLGTAGVQFCTYRLCGNSYEEEKFLPGHPSHDGQAAPSLAA